MNKVIIAAILPILLFGFEAYGKEEVEYMKESKDADMGSYSETEICKAATETILYDKIKTMKSEIIDDGVYKITSKRESDGVLSEIKCKIEGNRVHWGSFGGRWRTHELDSIIRFKVSSENLILHEIHEDSSFGERKYMKNSAKGLFKKK